MINALDPEVIIIGGGIAQAGSVLFDPLAEFMTRIEWRPQGHRVEILPAALGDVAGTLGAVYYAMNCGSNPKGCEKEAGSRSEAKTTG